MRWLVTPVYTKNCQLGLVLYKFQVSVHRLTAGRKKSDRRIAFRILPRIVQHKRRIPDDKADGKTDLSMMCKPDAVCTT